VISELFSGHYQTEAYFFEWQRGEQVVREPVSLQRVRRLIAEPEPDSEVEQGELPIRGVRVGIGSGKLNQDLPRALSLLTLAVF